MTATGVLRKVARTGRHSRFRSMGFVLSAVPFLAGCPSATAPSNAAIPDARLTAAASRSVTPVPRIKPLPPTSALPPVQTAALPDTVVAATTPDTVAAASNNAGTSTTLSAAPLSSAPLSASSLSASPLSTTTASTRPPPTATPETLVGLSEAQMAKLLGTPAAREDASPGRVWRYAKGGCRLDVFFFMDMTQSQDFRALSYDMKSNPNGPDSDRQCFAQLLAQSATADAGSARIIRRD